ncbi:unnamed protein product [Pocillopora meandrina]|uniref:Uncharacterized protein n=1 Tax=Pocillopora meandrina TaxID=46732 RepID=A0AAU9WGY0_9CNID|nr:unnamed protein product [Pocillopora meandrina]
MRLISRDEKLFTHRSFKELCCYRLFLLGMLKNACNASVEKHRQPLSIERTLLKSTTSFRFVPLMLMSISSIFLGPNVWFSSDTLEMTRRICETIGSFSFFFVIMTLMLDSWMMLINQMICCRYVAEYNKWSRMVHQSGDMCNHGKDSSTLGGEEGDICTDCLSGSPISGGSPQSNNGKGRKKKGKNKEKKQNSPRHEKQEKLVEIIDDEEKRLLKLMGWKDGGTESMECFSSEEDLCISEQEILRFKANQSSVSQQRRKLREKLRQQFNNLTLKEGLNVAIVH